MKKYRYLNTDVFVQEQGESSIRLLQSSKRYPLSAFFSTEGKVKSIINCSYFDGDKWVLGRNQGDEFNATHDQQGFYDLVFLTDGTYQIGKFNSWEWNDASRVLGGFSVATILIKNGSDCELISTAIANQNKITNRNPQTAIAVLKGGEVLQIVSDGRTSANVGINGYQLRDFVRKHYEDVELLVQLDGGGSSEMIVNGEIVNDPSDGKERAMWNGFAFIGGETTKEEVHEDEQDVQDDEQKDDEEMKIKVIDVSSYQNPIDYAKVKADGVKGVILRCGRTYWGQVVVASDSTFEKHYEGFKAVGMPLGAYYYSAANTIAKAKEEAQFVLNTLKGKQFEYPIYFDVENVERQQPLSKQALTDITKAFCDLIECEGYYVGIYASSSWLKNELDMEQLKDYDVWVAHYGVSKPSYSGNYGMWQYSSSGSVKGISGDVDMNWCYKDYPSIIKGAHLNGFAEQVEQPQCDHSVYEEEIAELKQENAELKEESAELKEKLSLWQSLIAKIKEILEMFK